MRPAPRHHHGRRATSSSSCGGVVLTCIRACRFVFPALVLLWLVAFSLAKTPGPASGSSSSSSSSSASKDGQTTKVAPPKSALRGATTTAAAVSKLDTTTTGSRRPAVPVAPTHAVIVAGHAVLRLNKMRTADRDDASWYLLPYQRGQDFPAIIASHIQKGIDIARRDPNALLLFSGGQTRRDVGPLSEAASYYYLAEEKKWFSGGVNQRTFLEEYARDSFENLLFSLCRFREASGTYPQKVTVVGFDFKGHRFTDLHRKAIGYPEGNFTYVGLRPSGSKFLHDRAASGELIAASQFRKDMYGCGDAALVQKRALRNPFRRTVPYELACPEMRELLHWCGPGTYDTSHAPWAATAVHGHGQDPSQRKPSKGAAAASAGARAAAADTAATPPAVVKKTSLELKREFDRKRRQQP